jgi:hypothetical protein
LKLIPLFEGQLRFDESTEVGFSTLANSEDGDWVAYVEGDGRLFGDRISGAVRWTNHPRRRADGTWLPSFEGVIKTEDEAEILLWINGSNRGLTDPLSTNAARRCARCCCFRQIYAIGG